MSFSLAFFEAIMIEARSGNDTFRLMIKARIDRIKTNSSVIRNLVSNKLTPIKNEAK